MAEVPLKSSQEFNFTTAISDYIGKEYDDSGMQYAEEIQSLNQLRSVGPASPRTDGLLGAAGRFWQWGEKRSGQGIRSGELSIRTYSGVDSAGKPY